MSLTPDAGLISGLPVGLEFGPKRRVFAQAIGWPGWCRSARDETRAVEALTRYADRYRLAMGPLARSLGTGAPEPTVLERVAGDGTTDFGAPGAVLASDRRPLEPGDPERLAAFLDACWNAFDAALTAVPRAARAVKPDAGRSPERMRAHLGGALRAYLAWLARPLPAWKEEDVERLEPELRRIMRDAVLALPLGVPFEGQKRTGPYAVRRECWHVLDHAWELQDRLSAI